MLFSFVILIFVWLVDFVLHLVVKKNPRTRIMDMRLVGYGGVDGDTAMRIQRETERKPKSPWDT